METKIEMTPDDHPDEQQIACPFCGESDFDLMGLKIHLVTGSCEQFDALKVDGRHFIRIG